MRPERAIYKNLINQVSCVPLHDAFCNQDSNLNFNFYHPLWKSYGLGETLSGDDIHTNGNS